MTDDLGMARRGLRETGAAVPRRPGRRRRTVVGTREDDRTVAAGSVHVHGECAGVLGAATGPAARGRGARSALLTGRARAAKALGCRRLVAEADAPRPGVRTSSLRDMLRAGHEGAHERVARVRHAWRPRSGRRAARVAACAAARPRRGPEDVRTEGPGGAPAASGPRPESWRVPRATGSADTAAAGGTGTPGPPGPPHAPPVAGREHGCRRPRSEAEAASRSREPAAKPRVGRRTP